MKQLFRLIVSFFCFAAVTSTALGAETAEHSVVPSKGFVPDEQTAIKIAEAIWLPIYGTLIYNNKPFHARLKDDVWIVEGSLPRGMVGGVPLAEISKSDGRVLRVMHGK